MDPLLLEALRFGLAILAGGLVGVIAARRAFHDARRLQSEREERAEAALRRALVAEIRENVDVTETGRSREGRRPFARVRRSAWDAARTVLLSHAQLAAVAAAYHAGDIYNAGVEMMVLGTPPGGRVQGELDLLKLAPEAHAEFQAALRALEA